MKRAALAVLVIVAPRALAAQSSVVPLPMSAPQIRALADSIAAGGNTFERTQRLVYWINDSFVWSNTDYVKRTPQEIIAIRHGNCAELASVLRAFLDASNVRSRWMHELNVQPEKTPGREERSTAMIKEKGNSASVFGLQHNDHVWLEVWDDAKNEWFPADAAYGVVGLREWVPARLAMDHRPKPRVAAVEPIAADMIAPFVVLAGASRNGPYTEDRSTFYLIDGFNTLYDGKLSALPSWKKWTSMIHTLAPRAHGAFEGKVNLHDSTAEIAEFKATYDALAREAAARSVHLANSRTGN